MNDFTIPEGRNFDKVDAFEMDAIETEKWNRRTAIAKAWSAGASTMALAYTLIPYLLNPGKKPERAVCLEDKSQFTESPVKQDLNGIDLRRSIGHISLDLEHKFLGVVNEGEHAILDDIVKICRDELKDAPLPIKPSSPYEIPGTNLIDVYAILRTVFNFSLGPNTTLTDSLGLNEYYERHFDRANAALIYMTIGEKLGFPLSAVSAAGHIFLRWRLNDKEHMNFDTVYADPNHQEVLRTDEDYAKKFKIPEESVRQGVFLRSLSKREALSLTLDRIAQVFAAPQTQRYSDSIMASDISLALNPRGFYAHAARGFSLEMLGRKDEALESYEQSLKLHPDCRDVVEARDRVLSA